MQRKEDDALRFAAYHSEIIRKQILINSFQENASRYFTPEPVLKRTMVSPSLTVPFSIISRRAGRHAAPSGAQKMPSAAPISPTAARSSSSETAMAVPPE